jgi:hypothetical protein
MGAEMIGQFVRTSIGSLARSWLRKRLFFLAKLPILMLGFGALLMTTDLFDTLKTMWTAGATVTTAYEQAAKINQPVTENEHQSP